MTAENTRRQEFTSRITALIDEAEACLAVDLPSRDRETRLQREAFTERCRQARSLLQRLASASEREWSLRSGDAYRIQQSLHHSLQYFRQRRD